MMDIIVVVFAASYTRGEEAALRTRTLQMTNVVSVIAVSLCRIPGRVGTMVVADRDMLQRCTCSSHIFQGSTCLAARNCFSTRLAMGTAALPGLGHCRKSTSSFNSCAEAHCKGAKAEQGANA
jgi:hypothetical protein